MSKLLRAAAVLAASGLAVPVWAVPVASAATATENASNGAYFYSAGVAKPDPAPAAPPNVTADRADGVSPGNLAVASQGGGQEDKVSFLAFSLADAPLDATIDNAVLTVPVVPNSPPNDVSFNAKPELVRVCKAGSGGFYGEDGASLALAPERLCDEFASEPGTLSQDGKAYLFEITALANEWMTANDGLALTVVEEAAPFQVVFAPAEEATLAYEASAPAEPPLPATDSGTTTDFGSGGGSADLGGGFGSGFDDGAFDAGDTGGFGSVEEPVVSGGELPAPAEEAPAEDPQVALSPAVPAAAVTESLRPTPMFWLGAVLVAAVAALLSLIMGDPRLPQATGRQSRLSQALQARERSTSTASRLGGRPVTT
jgi:hypothetical protein